MANIKDFLSEGLACLDEMYAKALASDNDCLTAEYVGALHMMRTLTKGFVLKRDDYDKHYIE